MKFPKALLALALTLVFSICLYAQDLPDGFIFDNADKLVYQVQPNYEHVPGQVAANGTYQAFGLAVDVINDYFILSIINALPEKGDLIFKKQKNDPITITVDGEKIMGGGPREVASQKLGKAKYEAVVVQIGREDFEKIIAANKLYVEFGKFSYLASAENLQAFRYLSGRLEKDELPENTSITGGAQTASPNIQVKGYYRKDGTYVKPHTRKRPKN